MQELKELTREIKAIRETTNEIYSAIQGNDKLGQKGLKHTIEEHGTRLSQLEEYRRSLERSQDADKAVQESRLFKARWLGFSGGAAATATAMAPKSMWGKLWGLIQSLFNASS